MIRLFIMALGVVLAIGAIGPGVDYMSEKYTLVNITTNMTGWTAKEINALDITNGNANKGVWLGISSLPLLLFFKPKKEVETS